ncbi:hypothetical protein Vadar_033191 [Vaccinium darrowii]|uniref:Uncharacterized protein n=1 Tax=Vaccinium darrowii TaxID=229202 RepID=A0ACB7X5V5_9ERIC|nr:hypothetical protein Vadar_033191 [Vaccinium darrowii]
MEERCKELPEELWESILNRLTLDDDYGDLQSPSLVCKQFLTITNRLRRKLVASSNVFYSNKCEILSRALDRFKNLKEMELVGVFPESDVDYFAMKIAFSALDLQSLCFRCFPISPSAVTFSILGSTMKNLKVLRCREFGSLQDTDLVHIADAFPTLEELDIRKNLTSLKVGYYGPSRNSTFAYEDLKIYATGLRELHIWGYDDQGLLCSIAKAGIPLEKLKLVCHFGFDICRVTTLLRLCPTLKHFKLEDGVLSNDDAMRDLCRCLPNIVSIKLRDCSSLTPTTFSILTKECPALSEVTLNIESSEQIQDDWVMNLGRNYRIRYLDLSNNRHLNDKLLKDIAVSCPNLHTLKRRIYGGASSPTLRKRSHRTIGAQALPTLFFAAEDRIQTVHGVLLPP